MKYRYVVVCFFFSILFMAMGYYILPFVFLGIFLFILGLILSVIKVDKALSK